MRQAFFLLLAMLCVCLAIGCAGPNEGTAAPDESTAGSSASTGSVAQNAGVSSTVWFEELPATGALAAQHEHGVRGRFYMPEIMGSGVALIDFDSDGDLDLFLPQGADLDAPTGPETVRDRLLRNDLLGAAGPGKLSFTEITADSGIRSSGPGFGFGAAVGDVDDDGHPDLYVTAWGANQLWRNRGDGSFEDWTQRSGTAEDRWSASAAFLDYDRDGDLDLFVVNYLDFDLRVHRICPTPAGEPDYCGPVTYRGLTDRLWRNRGDGTFDDVSLQAGLLTRPGNGLGVVTLDADGDGWLDLFVANDKMPNFLWLNQGDGTFRESALEAGCAVNEVGLSEAGMGVDAADVDHDGDEDLLLAHLAAETNTFYESAGNGTFHDNSLLSGLGTASREHTAFGLAWIDADRDGWLDLLLANGHVHRLPALAERGDLFPYHQANQLFRNQGLGRFEEVAASVAGPAFTRSETSRGLAVGDLDNDGAPDAVFAQAGGPARVLRNVVAARSEQPWLGLRLRIREGGRDAVGAVVRLRRGQGWDLLRRVRRAGSYLSSRDPRLILALQPGATEAEVEVLWPDGLRERFAGLAAQRYHQLVRGRGSTP